MIVSKIYNSQWLSLTLTLFCIVITTTNAKKIRTRRTLGTGVVNPILAIKAPQTSMTTMLATGRTTVTTTASTATATSTQTKTTMTTLGGGTVPRSIHGVVPVAPVKTPLTVVLPTTPETKRTTATSPATATATQTKTTMTATGSGTSPRSYVAVPVKTPLSAVPPTTLKTTTVATTPKSSPIAQTTPKSPVATVAVPVKTPLAVSVPVKGAVPVKGTAPAKIPVSIAVPVKAPLAIAVPVKTPIAIAVPVKVPSKGAVVPVSVPSKPVVTKAPLAVPVAIKGPVVALPIKGGFVPPVAVPVKATTVTTVPPVALPVVIPANSSKWSGTIRVDAGNLVDDWLDPSNEHLWRTDRFYLPSTSMSETVKPCGTLTPLLCTFRIGSEIHYDIPVAAPDSIYRIVLTIMEPYLNFAGQRPMEISSGPKVYYPNVDAHTECGGKQKPCTLQIKTGATDGKLDIKIKSLNPKNKAVLIGFLVQEVKK